MPVQRLAAAAVCTATLSLLLAACAVGPEPAAPQPPTAGVQIQPDNALRALLPDDLRAAGKVVVGTMFGVPPSIFVDDGGNLTGISHEIGNAIGATLGVEFTWEEVAFPGIVAGIQSGRFDLSMGAIADSPERQQILDIVDLMGNRVVFLVQRGNPKGIGGLDSICGATIGILTGSIHVQVLREASAQHCGGNDVTVKEYASNSDAQTQVAAGRIDALRGPELVLNHTEQTAGGGNTFDLAPDGLYDNPFGIAIAKGRGTLSEVVRGALAKLVGDGTYDAILTAWGAPKSAFLAPEQVVVNGAGTAAFPRD